MEDMYISYCCNKCHKEIILLTEQVEDSIKNGKYLSCSHCGSKRLFEENKANDLRKCMDHNAWKKVKGKIRQVHSI